MAQLDVEAGENHRDHIIRKGLPNTEESSNFDNNIKSWGDNIEKQEVYLLGQSIEPNFIPPLILSFYMHNIPKTQKKRSLFLSR